MTREILALPMECWAWIPGFEGLYQVSTRGRVRSVDRWADGKAGSKQFIKGKILKPRQIKNGYLQVDLCRNGKARHFLVHRIVLEVWGDGNPENKPQVNHIDERKTNNDVYNLEWSTRKENINWGTGRKRQAASRSKAIQAIDPETGIVVKEFQSGMEAQRNGFSHANISTCCRGKRRHHKGFAWRFKE